jgi:hypothetical protein
VAKYLEGQSVVALNPDPERIDGVLLPFDYLRAQGAIALALSKRSAWREVTIAQATLNDGQSLLAVNDLFVGQKMHTSARYRIRLKDREEDQSASGIIISTSASSTGWYRSVVTGGWGSPRHLSATQTFVSSGTSTVSTGMLVGLFSVSASRS